MNMINKKGTIADEDFDIWFDAERRWLASQADLSEQQLYEIFLAQDQSLVENKIQELKEGKLTLERNIKEKIKDVVKSFSNEVEKHISKLVIEHTLITELIEVEKQLFKFKYYQSLKDQKSSFYDNKSLDIGTAKRFPIEQIVRHYVKLKKSGRKFVGLCPFHEENTPSFYLYPASNSFHCFGCQKNGDVITFISLIQRLSFPEAVRFLVSNT